MPWTRGLAIAAVPLAAALIVAGILGLRVSVEGGYSDFVLTAVLNIPLIVFGNVIARRESRNVVGALLASAGVVVVGVGAWDAYTLAAQLHPERLPTWDVLDSLLAGGGGWAWLYVPFALLALYFPTGRLPSPRWRMVVVTLPLIATAYPVLGAVHPTPYDPPFQGVPHALGTLPVSETVVSAIAFAMLPVFAACLVASAASLRVRYRRADEATRAQLKWLALAGLTIPGTLLLAVVGDQLKVDLVTFGYATMIVAIPAAIAIAILRYDLYDVDRALSTAVTYGLVTAALLALFSVTSLLGGLAVGDSRVAVAAATAICALALLPLRRRVQGWVNRKIYPLRQGALAAIEDLHARTSSGDAEPERLEAVLRDALHDPGLRVGYRVPGGDGFVDAAAGPVEDAGIAVRSGSAQIAVLVPQRRLPPKLARELADAVAMMAELVMLRLQLSTALEEVAASRTRLLHESYAERRRLERDIHDGAQQRLVSLGMSLRLAQRHLDDRGFDVLGTLDEAVAELGTAVAELRQIAHGLRPSSLDDGLGPALAMLTSKVPIPVDVEVSAGDLDDTVSTTAYFVAAEAVANAVKHAHAGRIVLSVQRNNGHLTIHVQDDGTGGAVVRPGSGLAGLQDRVAALGGFVAVTSPAQGGTIIRAVLPCAI